MPNTTTTTRKPRRMARTPEAAAAPVSTSAAPPPKATSRLHQLQALLTRENGASIAEMVAATGWQQHSVRGALAGALKKRGLIITSEKLDGVRRYCAEMAA
ncbi:DUF3489 domain-containing protein [Erythrobacter arachoides]|uniref:DUF3489 domain-containing protein n=1 Tax=Aurantiacibacter arachoides TaxID=1850444 RepID=A0A845A074_9SPHN|nr:DUF3489 domain-containing protein [Aurantiacibacter arachoides]MXO93931.1 DUF3489 domain-containing protein [Aurantiacibacter arachoides]GGD45525.1 hypothetical protein GCM10011411_01370 [Aurantiacibacter arachoides]